MSWKKEVREIEQRKRLALLQGGESATEIQHLKGRLTVRERIAQLVDPDSFEEIGLAAGSARRDASGELTNFEPANFIVGFGKVDGRRIVVGGEDFTLKGGLRPQQACEKAFMPKILHFNLKCRWSGFMKEQEAVWEAVVGSRRVYQIRFTHHQDSNL